VISADHDGIEVAWVEYVALSRLKFKRTSLRFLDVKRPKYFFKIFV
jgi:hypothetical protein